jgi:hypothetical protein
MGKGVEFVTGGDVSNRAASADFHTAQRENSFPARSLPQNQVIPHATYQIKFVMTFAVVITRNSNQLIRQFVFKSLQEARHYFNRVIQEKFFGQVQIRLIEKRDYCRSFLLDVYVTDIITDK